MWNYLHKLSEKALKKARTPLLLKEASWRLITWVAKADQADPISWLIRPWVAHKGLKRVVGVIIAILAIFTAIWGPIPSLASNTGGNPASAVLSEGEVEVQTVESVHVPLDEYRVSQGYWFLHPGVDLATKIGEPVHVVAAGKVEYVARDRFGYGNHVIVNHGEYQTLYGHLSKIEVKEGQEVTKETEIGLVGSTGHSSGPHLHLEIREGNKTVNPKSVLDIK